MHVDVALKCFCAHYTRDYAATPTVCNRYTRVQCASLFFPQIFGQICKAKKS